MGKKRNSADTTGCPKSESPLAAQKKPHRRSAQACESCKIRKRKCDGSQPCAPCVASNQGCTYPNGISTSPNPTQRIRLLESHLRHASLFVHDLEQRLASGGVQSKLDLTPALDVLDSWSQEPTISSPRLDTSRPRVVPLINMLAQCHRLLSFDAVQTSYFGPQSEISFILRTLEIFDRGAFSPERTLRPLTEMFGASQTTQQHGVSVSSGDCTAELLENLPEKRIALQLVQSMVDLRNPAFENVEGTHFLDVIDRVYAVEIGTLQYQNRLDLLLLHSTLALCYSFHRDAHFDYQTSDTSARAWSHYSIARRLLGSLRHQHLIATQATIQLAIFLISNNRMTDAHGLIGQAWSNVAKDTVADMVASPSMSADSVNIHAELVKLDLYVSILLDLPRLATDEVTQHCLLNLQDLAAEARNVRLEASGKHLELLYFTYSAKRKLFPEQSAHKDDGVDLKSLRAVAKDLHRLTTDVAAFTARLTGEEELAMLSYELDMAAAFSELELFRPFLHYLCFMADGKSLPVVQSRYALACIKVASTTITRSQFLLSHTSSMALPTWSTTYTLVLAIMALVFLISAHAGTSRPGEAWKRASLGIQVLYAIRTTNDCASAGLEVLKIVVNQLNHTVDFDFEQIEAEVSRSQQRRAQAMTIEAILAPTDISTGPSQNMPAINTTLFEDGVGYATNADQMLARAEGLPAGFGFVDLLNAELEHEQETMESYTGT